MEKGKREKHRKKEKCEQLSGGRSDDGEVRVWTKNRKTGRLGKGKKREKVGSNAQVDIKKRTQGEVRKG